MNESEDQVRCHSEGTPRILIVKLSAIGDCLLASPVAEALRKTFPNAKIDWAVHPHCAPVIRGNPFLDEIHIVPRKEFVRHLPQISRNLKARRYDVALDLQGLMKSAVISRLSQAKRRVGPAEAREFAGLFYSESVSRQLEHLHVVPGYLELAKAIGAQLDDEPSMLMPFSSEDVAHVESLLDFSTSQPKVVLNPSAGKAIKQWPAERFGQLGQRLIDELGAQIVVTGAPADRELANRVLSGFRDSNAVHDVVGKTNLNQLAALLSKIDLFIGGDTGPMHIAQASGTRVLAMFGPTDPTILGPRKPIHQIATLNEKCSPCRHRECPIGRPCLENMSVDWIFAIAKSMLQKQSRDAN